MVSTFLPLHLRAAHAVKHKKPNRFLNKHKWAGRFFQRPAHLKQPRLLDLDLGAGVLELLLEGFGVGLGNGFLDGLRCAVDEILGFLEA